VETNFWSVDESQLAESLRLDLTGAPAHEAVSITVLVVGASSVLGGTVEGGLNLGKAMTMSNCNSRNSTGLNHNRSSMVLDDSDWCSNSDWCRNGDSDLLAHLTGHLLSDGGAHLASNLVALLHWGHHWGLHWH